MLSGKRTRDFLPREFPYGDGPYRVDLDSILSSPVEPESDEEDYLSGLAQRMAGSVLDDDEKVHMEQFSWVGDGGFGNQKLEHIAYGSKIVTKGLQSGIGGIGKNKNSLETTLRSGAFSI
ncbi:hypothetical protein AMTRI_Chr06g174790 [Amborella trichopoda]|uniref:uncharacterized protein LOC105420717 isoform X1 n=1 Tax=Amborella trichopoda TaxID=13333 RepID=UPI0009C1A7F1|nr:uncharacterized protein LOC105420717 isoform X1 [Amborella trichopoda]|eukprot:XP_020523350.1 uncharacterized protein LOC105420717 isoform X1 [Amborella trichopoda]